MKNKENTVKPQSGWRWFGGGGGNITNDSKQDANEENKDNHRSNMTCNEGPIMVEKVKAITNESNGGGDDDEMINSLLKLSIVPFHRVEMGSQEEEETKQSSKVISFLSKFEFYQANKMENIGNNYFFNAKPKHVTKRTASAHPSPQTADIVEQVGILSVMNKALNNVAWTIGNAGDGIQSVGMEEGNYGSEKNALNAKKMSVDSKMVQKRGDHSNEAIGRNKRDTTNLFMSNPSTASPPLGSFQASLLSPVSSDAIKSIISATSENNTITTPTTTSLPPPPSASRQYGRRALVQETPALYETVTLPYIQSILNKDEYGELPSWAKNIISKSQEENREGGQILLETDDYVLIRTPSTSPSDISIKK
eukprot:3721429-Ditylum_brightwellii.AAC.1